MDVQRKPTSSRVGGASSRAPSPPLPAPSPEQAADYIAMITAELHRIAVTQKLSVIAYLLDMARLEAETTARAMRAAPAKRAVAGRQG